MTDAAWERAVEEEAAALAVWDVALSVAAPNVGPGDLAALAAADSAWAWSAAWSAALLEVSTWDSLPSVAERWLPLEAEAADSLARFFQPWATADSAVAAQVFAEWAGRRAGVEAAYDAAEATKDSAAVAAYDTAQDRFLATQKDAADSAADRAAERARQAVFDAAHAAYDAAWETRWRTRPGTAAREAAVAGTERASAALGDWDAAWEAGAAAERAHGGGSYYAALRARETARDAAEADEGQRGGGGLRRGLGGAGPVVSGGAGNEGAACGVEGTGGRGRGERGGGGVGGGFKISPKVGTVSGKASLAHTPRENERRSAISAKDAIACFGVADGSTSLLGRVVGGRRQYRVRAASDQTGVGLSQ